MSSYRYWNGQVYDHPPGYAENGAMYDIELQPVKVAEVPPVFANAPRWYTYDFMGDIDGEQVAEPQFGPYTLQGALEALERWRAKARVQWPTAKREVGYMLAEGECAIIHHTPPGPRPIYTAMLRREAMIGGAYYEYNDAHCNHIIIGKLPPGAYIEGKPADPAAPNVSEAAIAARIEKLRGELKINTPPEMLDDEQRQRIAAANAIDITDCLENMKALMLAARTVGMRAPIVEFEGNRVRLAIGGEGGALIPILGGGVMLDPETLGDATGSARIAHEYGFHCPAPVARYDGLFDDDGNFVPNIPLSTKGSGRRGAQGAGRTDANTEHKQLTRKHKDALAALRVVAASKTRRGDGAVDLAKGEVTSALRAAGLSKQSSMRAREALERAGLLIPTTAGGWVFKE
jgi:hypothetical protein